MNANIASEILVSPLVIAASQAAVVSKQFRITSGGSQLLRVELFVGKVAITTAATAKLQDSSAFNTWNDTKSVSVTASTEKTVSAVSTSTGALTSAAHGYSSGQAVVVNSSGDIPAGLVANQVYYVEVVDANNVKLHSISDLGATVIPSSAGSGTITLTAVRAFSVTFQANVAGDQTYIPLRPAGRVHLTTGAGDSVQLLSVKSVQEE